MKKISLLVTVAIVSCLSLKAEESLQQYAAKYKFPQGSPVTEVNIVFENGMLRLNSSIGNTTLEKTGDDQFYMPANSGTVQFIRNSAKKITGIKFDVQNISADGNREEKDGDIAPTPLYRSTFPIKNLPAMLQMEAGDSPIAVPAPY
jgi:Tfp pilus assembly protein PilE